MTSSGKFSPNTTYTQSYLRKAGIRFDFNVVDTVCTHKIGFSHLLALFFFFLCFLFKHLLLSSCPLGQNGFIFITSCLALYFVYGVLHYLYYWILRFQLRKDEAPLAVEAWAVVCLDERDAWFLRFFSEGIKRLFSRYAVVYKEIGTENPRFFITAAVSAHRLCFLPQHIGRVFLHRKNARLYTVDDKHLYQTVSDRKVVFNGLVKPKLSNCLETDEKRMTKDES